MASIVMLAMVVVPILLLAANLAGWNADDRRRHDAPANADTATGPHDVEDGGGARSVGRAAIG